MIGDTEVQIFQLKMLQLVVLSLSFFFNSVKPSEYISNTTLQFLIDFAVEKEMSSILIIKGEETGREMREEKIMK